MAEKKIIRFWRGTREKYNFLKENNSLSPWTRYSVIDSDGNGISEYFGENPVTMPSGQYVPVGHIVESLPEALNSINPYDRYLVGNDASGYKIAYCDENYRIVEEALKVGYGVRVKDRAYKCYVYNGDSLKCYDDVDCGSF